MKTLVIPCASGKRRGAGHLMTHDGKKVLFVGDPAKAAPTSNVVYARPDDATDDNPSMTWRDKLIEANRDKNNGLGLAKAHELYTHPVYDKLANAVGPDRFWILSAGWGLVPSWFRLPMYDITFSKQAKPYQRRNANDKYHDFALDDTRTEARHAGQSIVFFGGRDYLGAFERLTRNALGKRVVWYAGGQIAGIKGCHLKRYGPAFTNWHYKAVLEHLGSY